MEDVEKPWDVKTAADYLTLKPDTLVRKAHAGEIKGYRLGKRWRFWKADLDAQLIPAGGEDG